MPLILKNEVFPEGFFCKCEEICIAVFFAVWQNYLTLSLSSLVVFTTNIASKVSYLIYVFFSCFFTEAVQSINSEIHDQEFWRLCE